MGSTMRLIALLLLLSNVAQAQNPRPEPSERAESAPVLALGLSPGQVRNLNIELDEDLRALDAFSGVRGADNLSRSLELPGRWILYGRLGVLNFRNRVNEVDPEGVGRLRFSFRRSGPKLTGRIYLGIHRQW